ncbi:MAG: HD-like signal output (HDOD) protein, partial [Granulosicoccus sp.]
MYNTNNDYPAAAAPGVTSQPTVKPSAHSRSAGSDSRLSIWLKKLPKNPLPINQTVANEVLSLLRDDNCNSPKLASCIQKDPLLCLKLFHGTEKQLNNKEGDIQHLVHLIGLVGMNKIEHVVNNSRKIASTPDGFMEILSASLFAAHLASTLLNKKHNASSDRFFLPCLFFNAPLWLMWVAAPKTMAHGKILASSKPQSYIALSVKKLGFKLP